MKTEIWNNYEIRFVEKDGEWMKYEIDSDGKITLSSFLSNLPILTGGKYFDEARTISEEGVLESFGSFILTTKATYRKTMWDEIDGIAVKHPFPVLAKVESAYESLKGKKILPHIFGIGVGKGEIQKNLTQLFCFEEREPLKKHFEAEEQNSGVYLIRGVGTNMYKIGCTTNIEERLKNLQIGSPVSLELIAFFPTKLHTMLESKLHRMYAENRKHGEWFNFSDKELESILDSTVELMTVRDKYGLDISVAEAMYRVR